jgi:serine/threonine-protein kinase
MGAVYQAWDTRLNRPIALKEMSPQAGMDDASLADLRRQFQQEAQVLATLSHPNLVRVTDYFSWMGSEYLVMDFVEGESLAALIQRQGAQPEARTLAWARQLLGALSYCHSRGVLHRDIKPQNIIIDRQGSAILVDFGLVKLWDPYDPQTRTVMRGMGTPEYAPPEQYDTGPGHTDPRSDVYGIGATLYHALTGQLPPTATQRMANPTSFVAPRRLNPSISPAVETAVLKALEIAKDRRYQSTSEMAAALSGTQRSTPVPAVVPTAPAPPAQDTAPARDSAPMAGSPKPKKRNRLLGLSGLTLVLLGALCLVLAAAAGVIAWRAMDGGGGWPGSDGTRTDENILFQDDFASTVSGWEVGNYDLGSVGYKDGAYSVVSFGDLARMWGMSNRWFGDVAIDVDVTQVSAPPNNNNGFGIICRDQGNGDGYYLLISGDGLFAIYLAQGDDAVALAEWTESEEIRRGNATNHLRAVCDGSTLSLYVNDVHVATAEDDTFGEGDISLAMTSFESEPSEALFDNLVVRTP